MSKKQKNAKKSSLYKILSAVIVIILALGGYLMSETGNDPADMPASGQSAQQKDEAEQTDARDAMRYTDENADEYEDSPEIVVSGESRYDYYLTFYSEKLLNQHYEKHGEDMGFDSPKEYEEAANRVVYNEETMHKTEKEDGDDVYYLEDTNEFVIVSTDGYIRTYFLPDDGIDYFNRQ